MTIKTNPLGHHVIGERTRDLIAPDSKYSLFLCHEGTGTALTDSAPAAQQIFGDVSPSTMVSVWGTEGNYEPDGNQTYRNTTAGAADLMATDTLTNGQLIISCDIIGSIAPATNSEGILSSGNSQASGNGGMRLSLLNSGVAGRAALNWYGANGTTAQRNGDAGGNLCNGSKHNVFAVIDAKNLVGHLYIDGVLQATTFTLGTAADLTSADTTYGTTLFCDNVTGPSFVHNLGGEGSDVKINRLLIMRCETDMAGQIATLAQQMSDMAHELPWGFDGL